MAQRQREVDVLVEDQGTIVALRLVTEAARAWVDEHTQSEPWQWLGAQTFCIEPRCAPAIIEGLIADGLVVR